MHRPEVAVQYRQPGKTDIQLSGIGPLSNEEIARAEMVWRANFGA